MQETWRWFGAFDTISLDQIAATGARGIVSALHDIPYGAVWPRDAIAAHKALIEAAGFTWDVVESLPVAEDIKRGTGDLAQLFANYRTSLRHLAAEGVTTVCYNFMPVLDWTRTDLQARRSGGGTCLRFSAAKMAAFEMHMVHRESAAEQYSDAAIAEGTAWFQTASDQEKADLLQAIISGLPGTMSRYDIDGLRAILATYREISHADLRANLLRFLKEVIPAATDLGIALAIHPDDPPMDILGLPRIVSTTDDIAWILNAEEAAANGLTFCTGSLGARADNDLLAIARAHGDRTHFLHLRNVTTEPCGSFSESGHLTGDVPMVDVIDTFLDTEARRGVSLPYRADHGPAILSDLGQAFQPGYTLVGRLQGLAELRGVIAGLNRPQRVPKP